MALRHPRAGVGSRSIALSILDAMIVVMLTKELEFEFAVNGAEVREMFRVRVWVWVLVIVRDELTLCNVRR